MTAVLEPVLTGAVRVVEVSVRQQQLNVWRKRYPNLIFEVAKAKNNALRVTVTVKPTDLQPADHTCYVGKAEAYARGNSRGRKWWGIEVGANGDFVWLDNWATKEDAEAAARAWLLVHGIDPETVT